MPPVWTIVALVIAIVSVVLAVIGRDIASPTYLILLAVFVVLFTSAKWPW